MNYRFVLITFLIFLLIYLVTINTLYIKEITSHPCQLCAKSIGNKVQCVAYLDGIIPSFRTFYPNSTVLDSTFPG